MLKKAAALFIAAVLVMTSCTGYSDEQAEITPTDVRELEMTDSTGMATASDIAVFIDEQPIESVINAS